MLTEAQRQQRRKFLGSSDSPVIMGLSPYKKTPADIYWSKLTDLPDEPTDSMDVGTWIEQPLLEWAADELGVQITTDPDDLFAVAQQGEGKGLFCANHDSLIVAQPASIEGKFANGEMAQAYGDAYTDQVPHHVIVQVQHQMYASELEKVYVALAVPSYYGLDRRLYVVPRDDEIIDEIVRFGLEWWHKHIEAKLPPDGETVPPLYVLKAIDRRLDAQIRLPDDAVSWADERTRLKENIKALTGEVEALDTKLIHALGDAEIGLLADGRKVTYHQTESHRFDSTRFKLEHPELAPDYVNLSTYRTLRIKKK